VNCIVRISVNATVAPKTCPTPLRVYFFNNIGQMIGSKNVETVGEACQAIFDQFADLSVADIQAQYTHPNTLALED